MSTTAGLARSGRFSASVRLSFGSFLISSSVPDGMRLWMFALRYTPGLAGTWPSTGAGRPPTSTCPFSFSMPGAMCGLRDQAGFGVFTMSVEFAASDDCAAATATTHERVRSFIILVWGGGGLLLRSKGGAVSMQRGEEGGKE